MWDAVPPRQRFPDPFPDERIPLFDLGIDPAIPAGPVGMLAKKIDASWNEEFQGTLKEWKD
jgi:hypothetical protein